MRITLILSLLILVFSSCKKDKYTTSPQIKFKSINPNFASSDITTVNKDFAPKITIEITDAEGDVGFKSGSDTSRIYIKNQNGGNIDSFDFPDLQTGAGKNFKADVVVNLFDALECVGSNPRPRTDTLIFEVYVNDFENNKSNTITTAPVYFRCL